MTTYNADYVQHGGPTTSVEAIPTLEEALQVAIQLMNGSDPESHVKGDQVYVHEEGSSRPLVVFEATWKPSRPEDDESFGRWQVGELMGREMVAFRPER